MFYTYDIAMDESMHKKKGSGKTHSGFFMAQSAFFSSLCLHDKTDYDGGLISWFRNNIDFLLLNFMRWCLGVLLESSSLVRNADA